jgi:hypothetical protein
LFTSKYWIDEVSGMSMSEKTAPNLGHRRDVAARDEEPDVDDVTVEGREEPLGAERGEIIGISQVDLAELDRRARRVDRVGTHPESRARRAEDDAAGGVDVEIIGREIVRRGEHVGHVVPVDLATAGADRADRVGVEGAEVRPELVDRGPDRGGIGAGRREHRLGGSVRRQRQREQRREGQASMHDRH